MPEAKDLEVHKALADDTRYRLYRYLGLAGRATSVQELARRLSLHPNTLRPHLRRLEEAGLVAREVRKGPSVGRPQTLYAVTPEPASGMGDHRLLAEILAGSVRGKRSLDEVERLAEEWGTYLVTQGGPKPGVHLPAGRNLAILQEAMARAGFEPRFRRSGPTVEVTLRDCPFRDLVEEHRELVEIVHRGLLTGMLKGLKPAMRLKELKPFAERGICRLVAAAR